MNLKLGLVGLLTCVGVGLGCGWPTPTTVQAATWHTGTPTRARGTWRYRQGKKHYTVRIKKTGLRFVNSGHTGTQGRGARYRYLGDHTYLVKERTAHTKQFRQTTFKLKGGALYVLGRKYRPVAH